MKILFWCEPVNHNDNPTWFKYTADCFQESLLKPLLQSNPQIKCFIALNEALTDIVPKDNWEHIVFSQEELTKPFSGVALSELNKRYQDSYSPAETEYYCQLFKERLSNTNFDIVISWTPVPHLQKTFPSKKFLYYYYFPTPFGAIPSFDIGAHSGDFLNAYSEKIAVNNYDYLLKDAKKITAFKDHIKFSYSRESPFKDILSEFKSRYSKIILLPLSVSGTPMFDSYVKYGTQLEFLEHAMKNIPSEFGVIVTFHHLSTSHISKETIEYLRRKYKNIFISDSFFEYSATSMFLLNDVDAVINCSSTVGFWAALIWNKKIISVAPAYNHWLTDQIGLDNISEIFNTPDQLSNRDSILHWILTNQFIPVEIMKSDGFALNYINEIVKNMDKNLEESLYPKLSLLTSVDLISYHIDRTPIMRPVRAGILPTYRYEELLLKKDAIIVEKDIVLTNKDRELVQKNIVISAKDKILAERNWIENCRSYKLFLGFRLWAKKIFNL